MLGLLNLIDKNYLHVEVMMSKRKLSDNRLTSFHSLTLCVVSQKVCNEGESGGRRILIHEAGKFVRGGQKSC